MSPLAAVSSATCSTDLITMCSMLSGAAGIRQEPSNLLPKPNVLCSQLAPSPQAGKQQQGCRSHRPSPYGPIQDIANLLMASRNQQGTERCCILRCIRAIAGVAEAHECIRVAQPDVRITQTICMRQPSKGVSLHIPASPTGKGLSGRNHAGMSGRAVLLRQHAWKPEPSTCLNGLLAAGSPQSKAAVCQRDALQRRRLCSCTSGRQGSELSTSARALMPCSGWTLCLASITGAGLSGRYHDEGSDCAALFMQHMHGTGRDRPQGASSLTCEAVQRIGTELESLLPGVQHRTLGAAGFHFEGCSRLLACRHQGCQDAGQQALPDLRLDKGCPCGQTAALRLQADRLWQLQAGERSHHSRASLAACFLLHLSPGSAVGSAQVPSMC